MKKVSKLTKQQRINKGLRLLSNQYRRDKNSVRINVHNTLSHEIAKLIKTYELVKAGYEVYTEAIFKNGKCADIFVPEEPMVVEVLHSETEKMCKEKVKKYPNECTIYTIKSGEVIEDAIEN